MFIVRILELIFAPQVHSHKNKNCYRITDKQDISTHEHVFDKKTRLILLKLLNRGMAQNINFLKSSNSQGDCLKNWILSVAQHEHPLGILERVNGIVSTGKESVIVHADGGM